MAGNSSNSSREINCYISDEPRASYIVRAVCWALIILFALVGNLLVCRGASSRRNRPFTYYLVINLAAAELVIIFSQPFLFHYTIKPWSWIWGKFMCSIINPMRGCGFAVVTFTLAAIAVYRCIMILQPYRRRPTKCITYLVIAFSWIFGLVLAIPSVESRKVVFYAGICSREGIYRCEEHFEGSAEARYLYSKFLFSLTVAAPLLIMIIAYGIVVCQVKSHIRMTREELIDVSEITSRRSTVASLESKQTASKNPVAILPKAESPDCEFQDPTLAMNDDRSESKTIIRLENDVLNMIYIIIIVFFIFYAPGQILFLLLEENLFSITDWENHVLFYYYFSLLHAIPSALHPILYGTMSKVVGLRNWRCQK